VKSGQDHTLFIPLLVYQKYFAGLKHPSFRKIVKLDDDTLISLSFCGNFLAYGEKQFTSLYPSAGFHPADEVWYGLEHVRPIY
jgi:hypothetical protein